MLRAIAMKDRVTAIMAAVAYSAMAEFVTGQGYTCLPCEHLSEGRKEILLDATVRTWNRRDEFSQEMGKLLAKEKFNMRGVGEVGFNILFLAMEGEFRNSPPQMSKYEEESAMETFVSKVLMADKWLSTMGLL